MKTLIIYDSFFGNTEKIARAIGEGLSTETLIMRVNEASTENLNGLKMLIVGSPTRAFKPSPATTAFLKKIPKNALKGVRVAAFDTRIGPDDINSKFLGFLVGHLGYAAKPIANKLTQKGGELALPAEGFLVEDSEGPLKSGEIERAGNWAAKLIEDKR